MKHFPSAENTSEPHFVPFGNKFSRVLNLDHKIVIIRVRLDLNFFDLDLVLRFLLFFLFFGQLIAVLSEIDDFAHRRICTGSNLNEV